MSRSKRGGQGEGREMDCVPGSGCPQGQGHSSLFPTRALVPAHLNQDGAAVLVVVSAGPPSSLRRQQKGPGLRLPSDQSQGQELLYCFVWKTSFLCGNPPGERLPW